MNRMNLAAATGVLAVGLWQTLFASSAPSLDMRPRDPVQTSGVFPDVSERVLSDAKAAETEGAAYPRGDASLEQSGLGTLDTEKAGFGTHERTCVDAQKSNVSTSG